MMVFLFQPILMSYLPTARQTRDFGRNRDLARRLEPLVDRIVEVSVTAGVTRKLLFSGAVGLLILGVVSAFMLGSATIIRARRFTGPTAKSISTPARLAGNFPSTRPG